MKNPEWYDVVRRVTDSTEVDPEKLERQLVTWFDSASVYGTANRFAEEGFRLGFERASQALALTGV